MTIILTPLLHRNHDEIEALLDAAFGADRHGRTAYAIRTGTHWLEDFSYAVADEAGDLLALLQSWPVKLNGDDGFATPLIMVGPVAVMPEQQRDGLGRMMMDRLIADADTHADAHMMMIGDPEYYGRFWNFQANDTGGWRVPGPVEARRLLMRPVKGIASLPRLSGMLGPRLG